MNLRGGTALVTGGAVRVGRAISHALAREGARVVVHYNQSADAAEELVAEIRAIGGEAASTHADLRHPDQVDRLATEAEGLFGPVDVLINNASVFPPEAFGSVNAATWESAISVNLRAPFFLSQSIGRRMKERGRGLIVNVADLAGMQAWTGYAAHSISKAGLIHLTRIAARALAPEVRVAAIAPGTVLPPDELTDDEVRQLAERTPLRRIGSPDDVAGAVLYLAASDFVTGEILVVDGGRLLG